MNGTVTTLPPLVLVVDDSATFRAAISRALRDASYRVETAATGEAGLRAALRLRPDVVIVDRMLPDYDGTALVRNLKLDPAMRRTPCVLVTADEDRSVEFAALETGADAYVHKDADLEVLIARVSTLLRSDAPVPPPAAKRRVVLVAAAPDAPLEAAAALPEDEYELVTAPTVDWARGEIANAIVDCVVVAGRTAEAIVGVLDALASVTAHAHVPVMALAPAASDTDAVQALGRGADDCIFGTVEPGLYAARLRALIRRKEIESEDRRVAEELMRQRTQAETARLRAELAERESEFKSRFMAFVSHELRTPLNAILGFSQMLEQGVGGTLTDTQQRQVAAVQRNSQHLLALVNDVLDLSAIRAGRLSIRRARVAVPPVIEMTRSTISPLADQRQLTLHFEVPEPLPEVYGDETRIQQILFNLLSNAVKFTPPGGRVDLRASTEAEMLRIDVSDTGVGIRPEDLGRLFREFERLDNYEGERTPGTGLGLSLTKHLIELHGGRITVESTPGVGTTFSIGLPLAIGDDR
jgi:signal transduction histidine kinase